jgi:nucleoid-associated protein YgaU
MPKRFMHLFIILMTFVSVGCASKGLKVRGYMEDRPRVDQGPIGNSGFMAGAGSQQEPIRKTRKVFVVEVQKDDKPKKDKGDIEAVSTSRSASETGVPVSPADIKNGSYPNINLPTFREQPAKSADDIQNDASADSGYLTYVVEKDDTLQKIAKKFYDSFGKWPKIYEANKAVIKNPDFVKPGTTLKIPTE